ncbi:uncharacterized protein LOC106095712 [Stomoxys calcitrans]|uniref:DUF4780 domain-containing protein n=1 Tax=Stomoxys calcitrans TaxID=35570 RepID=A0A1I8NR42_STOCA|nr:uncharacterized protein LOC106095712 [Stomoxys calcitrans]
MNHNNKPFSIENLQNNNTAVAFKTQTFKVLKNKYRRACYLLEKIEENKKAHRVQLQDHADELECHRVIEEYQQYVKNKFPNHTPSTSTVGNESDQANSEGLLLALVNEDFSKNHVVTSLWHEIECKLSAMVIDYILKNSNGSQLPSYNSSKLYRGCRLIKCMDEFSKSLIMDFVKAISNSWEGLNLKLIPAQDVPRRPCARIWLPPLTALSNHKLLKSLRLHNPSVPMQDWYIMRREITKNNSLCCLVLITEEGVSALKNIGYRLRFGIRNAKVKIIPAKVKSSNKESDDNASNLSDDINGLQITTYY